MDRKLLVVKRLATADGPIVFCYEGLNNVKMVLIWLGSFHTTIKSGAVYWRPSENHLPQQYKDL
ncbi:hypothetical protein NEIELOOT_02816 [Neisseria elongata subsp. glycolytica ATCC 29315]|uniref:Uncharacterized protein n=1 Tax=Neisseria elongata subsp. glycolytica ATCC 29315 TaxID=546263 RepID=D4DUM1_NEIEG|nr:hypothetical protein NEIELOOT_02816 [Neisseria elongata subsp. glycolytica ATCC 29315]